LGEGGYALIELAEFGVAAGFVVVGLLVLWVGGEDFVECVEAFFVALLVELGAAFEE